MTLRQSRMFIGIIEAFRAVGEIEFHHGDAIGSDKQADYVARTLGCHMVIHPPKNPKYQAFCAQPGDTVRPDGDYIVRDKIMVDEVDFLIGTPKTSKEVLRSGTWATIRYARDKTATPIIKLEP